MSPLLKVFPHKEFLEVSNIQRKIIVERIYGMEWTVCPKKKKTRRNRLSQVWLDTEKKKKKKKRG